MDNTEQTTDKTTKEEILKATSTTMKSEVNERLKKLAKANDAHTPEEDMELLRLLVKACDDLPQLCTPILMGGASARAARYSVASICCVLLSKLKVESAMVGSSKPGELQALFAEMANDMKAEVNEILGSPDVTEEAPEKTDKLYG
jgi:hypothetical protein